MSRLLSAAPAGIGCMWRQRMCRQAAKHSTCCQPIVRSSNLPPLPSSPLQVPAARGDRGCAGGRRAALLNSRHAAGGAAVSRGRRAADVVAAAPVPRGAAAAEVPCFCRGACLVECCSGKPSEQEFDLMYPSESVCVMSCVTWCPRYACDKQQQQWTKGCCSRPRCQSQPNLICHTLGWSFLPSVWLPCVLTLVRAKVLRAAGQGGEQARSSGATGSCSAGWAKHSVGQASHIRLVGVKCSAA